MRTLSALKACREGMQGRQAGDEDQANRVTEQLKLHKAEQVQRLAMQVTE